MKNNVKKPSVLMAEEQLIAKAVEALIDKLGIVETMRFLSLKSQDQVKLDSVERHRRWQTHLDKDAFLKEILK